MTKEFSLKDTIIIICILLVITTFIVVFINYKYDYVKQSNLYLITVYYPNSEVDSYYAKDYSHDNNLLKVIKTNDEIKYYVNTSVEISEVESLEDL